MAKKKIEAVIAGIEKQIEELKKDTKSAKSPSKKELVARYYALYPDLENKQYYEVFTKVFGLTEKGAITYLHNVKTAA